MYNKTLILENTKLFLENTFEIHLRQNYYSKYKIQCHVGCTNNTEISANPQAVTYLGTYFETVHYLY